MLHNDASSVYIQFGGWNLSLPRTSRSLVPYTWSLPKHSSRQRSMQLFGVKACCCSCWKLIVTNSHSPVTKDNVAIVWHQGRETSSLFYSSSDNWLWSKNFFASLADLGGLEAIWFNMLQRNGDNRSDLIQANVLPLAIRRCGIICTKAWGLLFNLHIRDVTLM